MVRIVVNNNKSRVTGSMKVITMLHKKCKLKSPNYFWSTAWRKRQWDGFIRYVSDYGIFMTGYLKQVIDILDKKGIKWEIVDNRESFKPLREVKGLGDLKSRHYQLEAVRSIMNNRVGGIPFRRGILNEATNAGKNLIAAGIVANFSKNRRALFLIDSLEIFKQAVDELKKLLPGEVGQIGGGREDYKDKRLVVCMVQTLASRCKTNPKIKAWLNTIDIFIADECDTVATRKDMKIVSNNCYNAPVRIGMSGTPLSSKDKTRNQEVINFFGGVVHTTTNKQLVDWGYSSKPKINFVAGNTTVRVEGDYKLEYDRGIIRNKKRNKKVWLIAKKCVKKGPVVILIKYHNHIRKLRGVLENKFPNFNKRYKISYVHHKTPGRTQIIKDFNKDKIDVLVASMIIRRGMNLKRMRSLINASGGDSEANVLQIFGRGLRKEQGVKEKIDIWDFFDAGKYLQRHSKHRIRYYKTQGFEVNNLYE